MAKRKPPILAAQSIVRCRVGQGIETRTTTCSLFARQNYAFAQRRTPASATLAGLGTLGTFEGSVARLLARKLRRISNEVTATNQKVGSSNLSGRATSSTTISRLLRPRATVKTHKHSSPPPNGICFSLLILVRPQFTTRSSPAHCRTISRR